MTKSSDAFRTISEVADDLGIPKHVLRFWEVKFTQIKPMKRGGGRRYYRPADLELLRGIQHLLHREGYTIKGVQKILREQGVDIVKNLSDGGGLQAQSDNARAPASSEPARPPARRTSKGTGKASTIAQPATAPQTALGDRDRKRIIRQAIVELEIARAILKGAPPVAPSETQPRRRQAS